MIGHGGFFLFFFFVCTYVREFECRTFLLRTYSLSLSLENVFVQRVCLYFRNYFFVVLVYLIMTSSVPFVDLSLFFFLSFECEDDELYVCV